MNMVINPELLELGEYASKKISERAKSMVDVINLSIGEPKFGPPEFCLDKISSALSLEEFLVAAKSYETSKGSLDLRQQISDWYKQRYNVCIDPDTQVMITHGGVEAVALSIITASRPGSNILVTDPSYMLYQRAAKSLGRKAVCHNRPVCNEQYADMIENDEQFVAKLQSSCAIVVNSPENPSGYVLSELDWKVLVEACHQNQTWLILDEVYDSMAYGRPHLPPFEHDPNLESTILVNSFSKKFGVPGLRVGWIVGNTQFIEQASKVHDYIVLGVNRQYERVAEEILKAPQTSKWLERQTETIQDRVKHAIAQLSTGNVFTWEHQPMGGMFLFPSIRNVFERLPIQYQSNLVSPAMNVANFLLEHYKVAVVPGCIYGDSCRYQLRMVLCGDDSEFHNAIERLANFVKDYTQ